MLETPQENKLDLLGKRKPEFLKILNESIHQWLYLSYGHPSELEGLTVEVFINNKLPERIIYTDLPVILEKQRKNFKVDKSITEATAIFQEKSFSSLLLSDIVDLSKLPDHRNLEKEKLLTESVKDVSKSVQNTTKN